MQLLRLVVLNVPLRPLTCVVTPPCLVLKVLIGLASRQTNAIFYHASSSLMLGQSQCIRPVAFDELAKTPSWIISSSYRRRTLSPRGKMPQQFVLRLFVGFECDNFEGDPLLTFEPTTLCSLLLVISFSGANSASAAHFLFGVSLSFHVRQNSLRHPQLMIGFQRVLTSLVLPANDANVGVVPTGYKSVQLYQSQTNFFPTQKDIQTSGLGTPLQSLSQNLVRVNLTVLNGYVLAYLFHTFRGVFIGHMVPSSQP